MSNPYKIAQKNILLDVYIVINIHLVIKYMSKYNDICRIFNTKEKKYVFNRNEKLSLDSR